MDSDARTARLIDARRRNAAHKRRRTLNVIDAVRGRGDRVTFAGIAREAVVSSWFVRNQPDITSAITRAMREQEADATPDKRSRRTVVSTAGLHSDLLLARDEIRELRREREEMRQRLRANLGIELDHVSRRDLVERVRDLEQRNHELLAKHRDATAQLLQSEATLAATIADLAAARAATRRMMRDANAS